MGVGGGVPAKSLTLSNWSKNDPLMASYWRSRQAGQNLAFVGLLMKYAG
jgi:hypothetical protein